MNKIWGIGIGVVLAVTSSGAGCADDDEPAYVAVCSNLCDKQHTCSSNVDVQTCNSDCGELGPKLSDAYLAELDDCAAEKSCNELVAMPQLCERDARASIGPSQAASELCDAVVASFKECTSITMGTSVCLESVKVLADGSLRKAKSCGEKPCDERADCVQDALGIDLFSAN